MAWVHPMATRPEGVPETIRHLTEQLYAWLARAELARIEVMFARHRQTTGTTIERMPLFPVDPRSLALAQPQLSPLHNLVDKIRRMVPPESTVGRRFRPFGRDPFV